MPATLLPFLRHHLPALRPGLGRHVRRFGLPVLAELRPALVPVPVRPASTTPFPFSR